MSDYHPTEGAPPVDEDYELPEGEEGPPAPLVPEVTDAHVQKLRESAFEGRRRDMVQQKKDIIIEQASNAWCDRFPKWCIKPPVVVVIKESTSKVPCEGVTASK